RAGLDRPVAAFAARRSSDLARTVAGAVAGPRGGAAVAAAVVGERRAGAVDRGGRAGRDDREVLLAVAAVVVGVTGEGRGSGVVRAEERTAGLQALDSLVGRD